MKINKFALCLLSVLFFLTINFTVKSEVKAEEKDVSKIEIKFDRDETESTKEDSEEKKDEQTEIQQKEDSDSNTKFYNADDLSNILHKLTSGKFDSNDFSEKIQRAIVKESNSLTLDAQKKEYTYSNLKNNSDEKINFGEGIKLSNTDAKQVIQLLYERNYNAMKVLQGKDKISQSGLQTKTGNITFEARNNGYYVFNDINRIGMPFFFETTDREQVLYYNDHKKPEAKADINSFSNDNVIKNREIVPGIYGIDFGERVKYKIDVDLAEEKLNSEIIFTPTHNLNIVLDSIKINNSTEGFEVSREDRYDEEKPFKSTLYDQAMVEESFANKTKNSPANEEYFETYKINLLKGNEFSKHVELTFEAYIDAVKDYRIYSVLKDGTIGQQTIKSYTNHDTVYNVATDINLGNSKITVTTPNIQSFSTNFFVYDGNSKKGIDGVKGILARINTDGELEYVSSMNELGNYSWSKTDKKIKNIESNKVIEGDLYNEISSCFEDKSLYAFNMNQSYTFEGLSTGYIYLFKEIEVPEGYTLPNKIWSLNVGSDSLTYAPFQNYGVSQNWPNVKGKQQQSYNSIENLKNNENIKASSFRDRSPKKYLVTVIFCFVCLVVIVVTYIVYSSRNRGEK